MPMMRMSDGCALEYRLDGEDDRPVLMFSNSHGFTLEMWDPQIPAMTRHFRVLRYNNRDHGASDNSPDGPLTIEQIARDARDLIEGLKLPTVAFCGLSIGGMVGMWLAVNAAPLLSRIVLANTSAYLGTAPPLKQRIALIEKEGMEVVKGDIIQRSLSQEFRDNNPVMTEKITAMIEGMSPTGYIAGGHAVLDMDQRAYLSEIRTPALVIAGNNDTATPRAMGQAIAEDITGARFAALDAAHLSNIECADAFNHLILDFLGGDCRVDNSP